MCRIMTSNYNNCITENGVSISEDRGNSIGFKGRFLPIFAPKKGFCDIWHNNIGKVSEEENTKYYVKEYYNQVLSQLDPNNMLKIIPDGSILLCYEDNNEFCHRHLVAFWFELFLGMNTSEVIENPKRETVRRVDRPDYLKDILEEVIKENYDMNGFDNIKDAYEYNRKKVQSKTLNLKLTS